MNCKKSKTNPASNADQNKPPELGNEEVDQHNAVKMLGQN